MICQMCQRLGRRFYASSAQVNAQRTKGPPSEKDGIRFLDHLNRFVRIAPWGPRPERSLPIQQPIPKYALRETVSIPSTNKTKKGRFEVSADQFQQIGRVLKQFNVDNLEIEQNPGIFSLRPEDLQDCLELFRECGWEMYTADMVIYSWLLMSKLSAKDVLMAENFSVTRSVLRNLLTELEIEEPAQQQVLREVTETSADHLTIADLRTLAMREYLRTLYSDPADIQKIFKYILKNSGPFRPLKSVQRQFRILVEKIGLKPEKILKCPNILRKNERHLQELLQTYPSFYGIDMRILALHNPIILLPSVERLARLEVVLRKFNITPFQLTRDLYITMLAAETVERRLTAMKAEPDLWRYKEEGDFLALARHYTDVSRRLSFLRSMKVTDFSMKLLLCTRGQFHESLGKGRFQQQYLASMKNQHFLPIATFLGLSLVQVKKMLKEQLKTPIPMYMARTNQDMQRIVDCITSCGITKEQFKNCLSICLYPSHVVEKYTKAAVADPLFLTRKKQGNFLHYVLYEIEKETNFGGSEAWGRGRDYPSFNLDETENLKNLIGKKENETTKNDDAVFDSNLEENLTEKTKKEWFD